MLCSDVRVRPSQALLACFSGSLLPLWGADRYPGRSSLRASASFQPAPLRQSRSVTRSSIFARSGSRSIHRSPNPK